MAQGLSPATFHYHCQKRRRRVSPGFIEAAPVDQVSCPVEITYPNGVILKPSGQVSYQELRQLLDV